MKYLFDEWKKLSRELARWKKILLLTDYDGTLTPIVSRPELAVLNKSVRKLLLFISRKRRFEVGILSGRSIAQLKNLIGLEGIIYSGNHGFEIEFGGKILVPPEARKAAATLQKIYRSLSKRFSNNRQVIIEDKGVAVALHYRLLKSPAEIKKLKKMFKDIVGPYLTDKKVQVISGKKVLEVQPFSGMDKATALRWIVSRFGKKKTLVIYLGDDLADEGAFSVMGKKEISIFVGKKKRSKARYFLKNTGEVEKFLGKLNSLVE
jgi:trehalose 6-phosphate phosphatase